jgi:hypothetical protein
MSGYKRATVAISEQEYRRLHQADMKLRFREHAKVKTKKPSQREDLARVLQQIESRQQILEQTLSNLDDHANQIEANVMEEILRENARCYESLIAMIEQNSFDANASFASLSRQFSEEMQKQRQHYLDQVQSLVQRVDIQEQREQAKAESARQWLSQSAILAEFLLTQYDHERFLPGKLSGIYRSLEFAQNNLAQGYFESSVQTSQQAFVQLSDLQFELEHCLVEWQTGYERAFRDLEEFIAELQLNSRVNALGLQGEPLKEKVDLDYWTNGKFDQLLKKSRECLALLIQGRQRISTQELKHLHTELPSVLAGLFESIIYEARLNALNSQLRMNIAETALQALEEQGFALERAGYTNKDMRGSFIAHLDNPDGSHVKIQVLPTAENNKELTNELVVITEHPDLKTEQEARLLWEELSRSLSQFNLKVGRPYVGDAPHPATTDPVEQPTLIRQPLVQSERQHNVR